MRQYLDLFHSKHARAFISLALVPTLSSHAAIYATVCKHIYRSSGISSLLRQCLCSFFLHHISVVISQIDLRVIPLHSQAFRSLLAIAVSRNITSGQ